MENLINRFKSIRTDFLTALDTFPKNKFSEKLFGDWDLKDVVAHFSGWDRVFTDAINALKNKEKFEYWGKIYEFNDKVVTASKNKSWKQVVSEFKQSGQDFIDIYVDLPVNLFEIKVWKDKIYSPKRILEINIHHYEKAQLVKIKKLLQKWGIS